MLEVEEVFEVEEVLGVQTGSEIRKLKRSETPRLSRLTLLPGLYCRMGCPPPVLWSAVSR